MFTEEETARLFKRFIRIDKDRSGTLDKDEFLALPKMEDNPLAPRIIEIFDTNRDGAVDFQEFLTGIGLFARSTDPEDKLKFLFRVYDLGDDGFVSNRDLFSSLKIMIGDNLGDVQLQQVVDKTIREADKDGDGRLDYEEFRAFVTARNPDMLSRITVGDV